MSLSPEDSPAELAARLRAAEIGQAWLAFDPASDGYAASHPALGELSEFLAASPGASRHEAVFLGVPRRAPTLFAAFVHRTTRGQAQGGLRRRSYARVGDLLHDGLRLSRAMTRKNALAGLWWGGGKGILADLPAVSRDPAGRAALYREYGGFVSSLRGCYVTAEDVGTEPADMAELFRTTRFATCVPPEAGGSGNPASATAAGVLCALEAALDFHGLGPLAGKTVAVQGAGNVGSALIALLLERGVERIVASEVCPGRGAALLDRFEDEPLELRLVPPDDDSILAEPCDVLAPCGVGGVLGPGTIPGVRARIVCGPANNPLVDDERDASDLARRGVTFVPDILANRMGIVQCANEQYGSLGRDPAILRHLDPEWPNAIYPMTLRVLELAERCATTPSAAALRLADELAEEPHPLWPGRGRAIIEALLADDWARPHSAGTRDRRAQPSG